MLQVHDQAVLVGKSAVCSSRGRRGFFWMKVSELLGWREDHEITCSTHATALWLEGINVSMPFTVVLSKTATQLSHQPLHPFRPSLLTCEPPTGALRLSKASAAVDRVG